VWLWSIADLNGDGVSELIYTPPRELPPTANTIADEGSLDILRANHDDDQVLVAFFTERGECHREKQ
jgi:hypothetical protein